MKSRTGNDWGRKIVVVFMELLPLACLAQGVQSNPSQYVIIGEGQSKINGEISSQMKKEVKIAGEQNTMAGMYTVMKKWEQKYNAYLKTTAGYADALRAGTTLYAEGVLTLRNLYNLKKAAASNPQGIVASMSMNSLYMEVAIELVKTYRILKVAIAMGGKENMLTGAERTQLLWSLNDSMERLNRKLRRLSICIAYYNLEDVWNCATAGMTERDHGEIARAAQKRWRRTLKVYQTFNKQ